MALVSMQAVSDIPLSSRESPKIIDVTSFGASDADLLSDEDQIQAAINAAPNGATVVIPERSSGAYIFGANREQQILVLNKDSLTLQIDGTIRLSDSLSPPNNQTHMFRFLDCDNLRIVGTGTLDGNFPNEPNLTWGGGSGSFALYMQTNSQDSIHDISVQGLRIKQWFGDAVWIQQASQVLFQNLVVDSCGEGLVSWFCNDVSFRANRIGRLLSQDGIEPSNTRGVIIDGNEFYGDPGPGNVCMDIYYCRDAIVTNNRTFGVRRPLSINFSRNICVAHNEIGNVSDWPTSLNATDTSIVIEHNTFRNDSLNVSVLYLIKYDTRTNLDWKIRNNRFISDYAIFLQGSGSGIVIDSNSFEPFSNMGANALVIQNYLTTFPDSIRIVANQFRDFDIGLYVTTPGILSDTIRNNAFSRVTHPIWNTYGIPLSANFDLVAPRDSAVNQPLGVSMCWGPSVGAMKYWIQVSTDPNFLTRFFQDTSLTDTFRIIDGLSLFTKYYWRVKAHNDWGPSGWTAAWSFTTGSWLPVDIGVTLPLQFSIAQNYPNPFNPATVIRYQIPAMGFVELKVYDVLGREVETLVNEIKAAGEFSATFDASDFSSGVYIYRLWLDDRTLTKKMVLIR